jgi:enterochelin esterase family protein
MTPPTPRPEHLMRRYLFVTLLFPAIASAQPPRQAPTVSPEVNPDRSVTFRLRAPKATEVAVSGEWPGGTKPMTKDDQGVWSVTVGPLAPELYGYGFVIDGVRTADPGNPAVKPMRSPTTSILDVPGEKPLLHDFTDVPHGTVHSHVYWSKSLGKKRNLCVYTPPGYDKTEKSLPVLYLLHGAGDNEGTWTALGRAHFILDNLLAAGKVVPMIVVMTDGHAAFAKPDGARGVPFTEDFLHDVMPLAEANYHLDPKPTRQAIAGLSMGGGQSLTIGLNHPELFGWVGAFSAAVGQPETAFATPLSDPDKTNKSLKLLWIACGKDDGLIARNKTFADLLEKKGIKHQFLTTEGNHSWPVWRKYLAEFTPLLFKE